MSQQIQITGGAKVRNLEGVLTGSSGVVSSLGINVPSGIPQLDGSGKILVSQLPNSVMEFKGSWNVSTNTPTLVNGTGNAGDVYLVEGAAVGGTSHDFGAGPITFYNGDQAIYSGSIWQRASGATGTVTSVALTESGDSLNITGSPITTSGTINIGFNGNSGQYINGAGNLTTFPSLTGFVPYTGATTNVDLGTYGLLADYLKLNVLPTSIPTTESTIAWNDTDGTMDIKLKGGNVTLQVGQEQVVRVVNKSGASLLEANYQVVRIRSVAEGGAQGQRLAVVLAQGDTAAHSKGVLGLVTETIADNQEGFITILGQVHEIDTTGTLQGETWVDGDKLYLSATTAGKLTNVAPVAPNHSVVVGYVEYAHAIHGKIFVDVNEGLSLDELHNVYAPSPSNNQSIFWNSSNLRYENNSIAGALGYTPANAATYVPYTGATSNVNLGSYNLIAHNRIVGSAGSGGGAYSNTIFVNSTSITSGYENTIIGWNVGTLLTTGYYNTAVGGESLALITTGNDNTAFGGYALSTATGSYNTGIGSGAGRLIGSGSYNTIIGGYNGTSGMSSNVILSDGAGNIRYRFDGTNNNFYQNVNFGSTLGNGTYTYTLPSADGTIALTSDIPSLTNYVTLNGNQTITGIKTFTNEQLFGNGITLTGGYITYTSGSYNLTLNTNILTANRNVYLQDGSGTLAFTSDIPSLSGYVQGSGTTNYHAKFTASGTIGNSLIYDNGTNVTVGNTNGARLFNIYSATADNHLAIYGSAPSVSLSDTATSATYQAKFGLATASGQFATGAAAGDFVISCQTGSTIWAYNSVEKMRLNTNGRLLIGTTTDSGYLLDVNGTSRITGAATFSSSVTTNANLGITINPSSGTSYQAYQIGGTNYLYTGVAGNTDGIITGAITGDVVFRSVSGKMLFSANNGASSNLTITTSGNVGIGTSSPSTKLTVYGGYANFTDGTVDIYSGSDGSGGLFGTISNHYQRFITNNTERMRITSGGNVLIGTTTDNGNKLQVNGTAQSSAFITTSGSTSVPWATWTTTYSLSNYQNAIYLFVGFLNGYINYTCYATILQNDSQTVIANNYNSTLQVQMSGRDIQVYQNSGSTQTIIWRIIKIG